MSGTNAETIASTYENLGINISPCVPHETD
jgi:hypothetical protein